MFIFAPLFITKKPKHETVQIPKLCAGTSAEWKLFAGPGDTKLGFGVGGGIRYKLESKLVPMAEMKYINGGQDEFVINIGVLFQL